MNEVFISYSGKRTERAELFNALRNYGLRPWRDVESLEEGSRTTEEIEEELETCAGAILWIDERFLASDYVALVELPAISRRALDGAFRLVPIFDRMEPSDGAERLSRLGIEIGDHHGHVLDSGQAPETAATAIAHAYVRRHLKDAKQGGHSPIVRLVSYDDTAAKRDTAVLNFDWRHHFREETLDARGANSLRMALRDACAALKESFGSCEIELAVKAHLPLGVALGNALSEPTGCTLRMTRDSSVVVVSRDAPTMTQLRTTFPSLGPIEARRASVEVSVSRDVDAGVKAYIGTGNRYRHRVVLDPSDGIGRDAMTDVRFAASWGRQIAGEITRLADRGDVDSTDLFLACPIELAVSIGWWANAGGRINLMNWRGKNGPYELMWTLP
jgi:hypothetical protein